MIGVMSNCHLCLLMAPSLFLRSNRQPVASGAEGESCVAAAVPPASVAAPQQ